MFIKDCGNMLVFRPNVFPVLERKIISVETHHKRQNVVIIFNVRTPYKVIDMFSITLTLFVCWLISN